MALPSALLWLPLPNEPASGGDIATCTLALVSTTSGASVRWYERLLCVLLDSEQQLVF